MVQEDLALFTYGWNMLKLEIYKQSGEVYWTAYFDKQEALIKWLDEEKMRPYWNVLYSTQVTGEETIEPVAHIPSGE